MCKRCNSMLFEFFLLKKSFQQAFCCAAAYCPSRPTFVNVISSAFGNLVSIGRVLFVTAIAGFTNPPLVTKGSVDIEAKVDVDVE